jgi:hypothetical protein
MLWAFPPPDSLWKHPPDSIVWCRFVRLSTRTIRILRLQDLDSIGQLADATVHGVLHGYPAWLRQEVETLLRWLEPVMRAVLEAERQRRERLARLDWAPTVIGRPLAAHDVARLWDMDIRRLRCPWAVKHIAWYLDARDALDAAALDREQVLSVKTSGPPRLEMLHTAITRALRGDLEPDVLGSLGDYLSASHTVAGRSLSLSEVGRLAQQPATGLKLPARATLRSLRQCLAECLDPIGPNTPA